MSQPLRETAGVASGALSVAELTRRVKTLLEDAFPEFWVSGEVSGFKLQTNGHAWFTLKDETAQLPAVMFRGDFLRTGSVLRDGARVALLGRLSVYEPRGAYRMVVRVVADDGQGRLALAFEALKVRLAAEGLFASEKKRPLPRPSRVIALVTSPTGAALHDFVSVLRRRDWRGRVILFPCRVQGPGSAAEIATQIRKAGASGLADTLVIARGGGSPEDLWSFNEEPVVRAVAASPLPVISAVGHETDFSLSDFAADRRAETPTAAAELISSIRLELLDRVESASERLEGAVSEPLEEAEHMLRLAAARLAARSPQAQLDRLLAKADALDARLSSVADETLAMASARLASPAGRLAAFTPVHRIRRHADRLESLSRSLELALVRRHEVRLSRVDSLAVRLNAVGLDSVLKRGFALVRDGDSGVVLSRADQISCGRPLRLRFADGERAADAR